MSAIQGLPDLAIEIDGAALSAADVTALTALRLQQRLSIPAQCELLFVDPRGPLLDKGVRTGASLRIRIGVGAADTLFWGDVTAISVSCGPSRERRIRVRAYDLLHRLRKREHVRALQQVTVADLAGQLTADLGITVDAAVSGPTWPYIIQHQQSDLDLLVDLADGCGLYLTERDDVLHLLTLEGIGEPLALTLGETLLEAQIEINADRSCGSVAADGWDPISVLAHDSEATVPRPTRHPAMTVLPSDLGGTDERRLDNRIVVDAVHAEQLAQGELDRRVAGEVILRGVALGDAALVPGARVRLRGVGERLDAEFVLTTVTHTVDADRGFLCEIGSEPPPPRPPRAGTATALGTVSRVDDPDGQGRVRVKLPAFDNVETDWMQVLTLGAGPKKGLVMLPDVDDQVLVSLAGQDPARGWVIGGLYGSGGSPDAGVEAGAVRRYSFLSPAGHAIQLDDAQKTLRLRDSTGSYLQMSDNEVRLHATVPLIIEAPGQSILISGDTIDFRQVSK